MLEHPVILRKKLWFIRIWQSYILQITWVPELKIFPVNVNVIRQPPATANLRWCERQALKVYSYIPVQVYFNGVWKFSYNINTKLSEIINFSPLWISENRFISESWFVQTIAVLLLAVWFQTIAILGKRCKWRFRRFAILNTHPS